MYTRCRIGHTRLTHGHLLINVNTVGLMVKHVLLVCPIFNVKRQRVLSGQTLKDLLYKMDSEKLLQFLSKVNLKNIF